MKNKIRPALQLKGRRARDRSSSDAKSQTRPCWLSSDDLHVQKEMLHNEQSQYVLSKVNIQLWPSFICIH